METLTGNRTDLQKNTLAIVLAGYPTRTAHE
jgi:hypothetical protein